MRRTITLLLILMMALTVLGVTASPWAQERQLPRVAQCADGIDNDGDGLVDRRDPDCTSRLDNSEAPPARGDGDNAD